MKKIFGFLVLALSMGIQAQTPNLPQSQCPAAGVFINRDFLGIEGESVSSNFQREGTSDISTTAQFSGNLKARTFKVYAERFCVSKTYLYQQNVCLEISPDLALGRGNNSFFSIFDLNIAPIKRAEIFSRLVKYGIGSTEATRLSTASEVVRNLTRLASTQGIPKSWTDFSVMMKKIVDEGLMTQAEFDDIITVNAVANRKVLGFEPLPGAQYRENKGNGKLAKIFDLGLTLIHRAALIKRTLDGVSDQASMNLARSAIDFASNNGIPSTWNQLVLMLKDSTAKNAITIEEFKNITETFETSNRVSLGFEINYFACKMENRQHYYNVVEESKKSEVNTEVVKNFRIDVLNAPLLAGESESIQAVLHSLNGLTISPEQTFNTYNIQVNSTPEVDNYVLSGVRKLVTPKNSISTDVLHQGNKINVTLQNTAFNPLVGGKVVVEVVFFEKVVLGKDKKLATKTFELLDGNITPFMPNVTMIKPSRKAYVTVTMKIVGSPYYNEESTGYKEVME